MINGSLLLLAVGAWAAYKLACWIDDRCAPDREVGSHDVHR